jgi:hypothetical protein
VFLNIGQTIGQELGVFFDTVAPAIRLDFGGIHPDMIGYFAI